MNATLTKQQTVARQIADLSQMSMAELWPVWDRYFPAARTIRTARTSSRALPTSCRRKPRRPRPETKQRLEAIGAKALQDQAARQASVSSISRRAR